MNHHYYRKKHVLDLIKTSDLREKKRCESGNRSCLFQLKNHYKAQVYSTVLFSCLFQGVVCPETSSCQVQDFSNCTIKKVQSC